MDISITGNIINLTQSGGYVLSFAYIKQNTCETIAGSSMSFTNMMCLLLGAPILQPLLGSLISYYGSQSLSPAVLYQKALCLLIVLQILVVLAVLWMKKK